MKPKYFFITVLTVMLYLLIILQTVFSINEFEQSGDVTTKNMESLTRYSTLQGMLVSKNETKPKYEGYIIQFKDMPVIEYKREMETNIEQREKKLIGSNPVYRYTIGLFESASIANDKSLIETRINDQRNKIRDLQERLKEEVESRATSPLTGHATAIESKDYVLAEYQDVFSGIALNISDSEAQEIKNLDYVKDVYPNYEVHTLLMDSVPLINADDVWKLQDSQGRNITGKNITIAIIDTGIDYTRPDFGSCTPPANPCTGNVNLTLSPNPVNTSSNVHANVRGVYNCSFDLTSVVRKDSCNGEIACMYGGCGKAMPGGEIICDCYFTSPYTPGNYTYYGCVDKNKDGDYNDFGEFDSEILNVSSTSIKGVISTETKDIELLNSLSTNCKIVDGYNFVDKNDDPSDDNGHGTHCAGIAAGNGTLKGVAPDAKLIAYKVCNSGGGCLIDDIIAAIERAVDPNQDGDFSDHVDVISMSLGGSGNPDDPMSRAVDAAVQNGVVVVVAAGNSGPYSETIGSPGTARKAITVGASDKNDNIAYFSSRGPVTWDNGIILKPDIVAPGVSICSAQWDSAWNSYKCYDDQHVAISGTSMATPHVAGAVVLIKQSHPDWTPDQIKMALRNTAVDLGYDINTQGYGRLNVLDVVQLKNKPCVARIDTSGERNGILNVIGSAFCDGFSNYTLYYNTYERLGSWNEVYTSTNQVIDGNLYTGFDSTNLDNGYYFMKLVVRNIHGDEYEDNVVIKINNFEITSIGKTLNYINGNEDIKGNIKISDYDQYKIEYQKEGESAWNQICFVEHRLTGNVLCQINVDSFVNGVYYFRLSVLRNGKWLNDLPFKAVVIHEMLDNWPIELNGFPRGKNIVADIDSDGSKELIVPSFLECGSGWCDGTSLHIFGKDGSFRILDKLYKGSQYSNVIDDDTPSIYHDKGNNQNLIAMAGWNKLGLVDYNGNFMFNWPNALAGISPFVISDLGKYEQENKLFISSLDYTNRKVNILGFDKQGNVLENFPIEIRKENLNEVLVLRGIGLLNNNQESRLAIVAGDYNVTENGGMNLILYLDVYSYQGNLIKRTYLFDNTSQSIIFGITYTAAGDLNNDGNTEIVVSFSIVDFDLLLQDRYNIEAYKTYITVIDSNGNIISKPFEIKGYTINDIALGDFGRGKPDIVITLSDTWPTTYNGQKIVAFDYLGNILFNTALSDYNDLIQCLTIGDVNGDSLSEVIVNYRPRWYNENPSGFQIYDKKGVLVKELEIPTLGEVDDYWGGEPILTDFNNDGKIDIVQQSLFIPLNGINRLTYKTRIYALDLNSVYNEENIDWPMLLHDPQHTGLYKQPSTCGSSCINANMVGCCCDIGGDYDAWQKNQCYASPYKKVDVSNCEVSPTTCSWYCNSYDYSYGEIKGDACCCYNVSTTTTTTTVKTTTTTSTTTTLPNMSTTTTTTVPESVTVTYQISASDNDAYSGSTYLRNTDPDIFPAYTWYKNGLRWKIDIPPGSTIDSAYVKVFQYLFSGNSYTSTARLQLFTQCSSFDTVFWNWGVDSKYVDWQITFQNSASWITSPDIKTLIQDFINRPSYVKGSYLCLRLYNSTVNNGNGRFRTYDFSSNYGSKLEITYSSGITTTTSTSTTIGTTTTTTSTSTTINTSTTTEPTTSTTILTTTTTAISTSTTSSTTTTTSTTIVPITTTVPATTTTIPVTTTTIPVGQTKTYQISASYDDTYATSGSNYQTRNYVTFMSTMHGFLRWSIDIPPGSTINSAKVKVVAYSSDSSSYNVKFYLLNYADCVDFTSNPFSRTTTGTEVSWQTGIWTAETEYTSSDIKNLIQEFINMPGYNSGNHICLKIMHYGSNNKYFYSFEGSNTKAAKLEVTYTPQSTSLGILVHVFEKLITDIRNLFSFKPS